MAGRVSADWILKRIQEGKRVRLKKAVIEGNLDISKLKLPTERVVIDLFYNVRRPTVVKPIKSQIKITYSCFHGDLDLSNSVLSKDADFSWSRFRGETNFSESNFKGFVDFGSSYFKKKAKFRGSNFEDFADFSNSNFEDSADFSNSNFEVFADFLSSNFEKYANFRESHFRLADFRSHFRLADFSRSNFEKYANFYKSHFDESADFSRSNFEGDAYFRGSYFKGDAKFMNSHFEKHADFSKSNFEDFANFYKSYFKGDVDFYETYFEGDVDFYESHFENFAEFSGSLFKGDAVFIGSQINNTIRFGTRIDTRTTFDKSLILDRCKIYSIYIDAIFRNHPQRQLSLQYPDLTHLFVPWESIKDHIKYAGSAYLALIKNYNNLEWFEDADQCNYDYRTVRRKEHLNGIQWAIDCIPWLFYGYGVRFYNPLIGMLVVLVISAVFYIWEGQARFPDAFGLSAIILTTTTQVGSLTGFCWYLSIIERILGWLLMAAFLVALAKKTLR